MDFANYLAALAAKAPYTPENAMTRINIQAPADLFNPSARDGAALFIGLRMIPVALVLAAIFQAVVA